MRDYFPGLVHLGDATQFIDRIAGIVDRIRMFEDFSYEEVRRLAARMPCYAAPAGTVLVAEGEQGDFALFVISGRVRVLKRDHAGGERDIGDVAAGEILGEMSMIDGRPRVATCAAAVATEFAVIDREALTGLLAEDAQLGIKVLIELVQHLSQKLRIASTRLAELLAV